MFGLFGDKTQRQARRLNKDAPVIIEHARQTFRGDRIRDIALRTAEHLERAHKVFEANAVGLKHAIMEYQRLHREARDPRDEVSLSAFTLVLIYIRAEALGDAGRPAVNAIDDFIAGWKHTQED
jgi:hypothetical protein